MAPGNDALGWQQQDPTAAPESHQLLRQSLGTDLLSPPKCHKVTSSTPRPSPAECSQHISLGCCCWSPPRGFPAAWGWLTLSSPSPRGCCVLLGLCRLQVSPLLPSPWVPTGMEHASPSRAALQPVPSSCPSEGRGSSVTEKGTCLSLVFPTSCVFHFLVHAQRILTGSSAAPEK